MFQLADYVAGVDEHTRLVTVRFRPLLVVSRLNTRSLRNLAGFCDSEASLVFILFSSSKGMLVFESQ